MKTKILKAIKQFSLLENVKRVTVALSGGADSMALLEALLELESELNIEISAAHFNHKIRGEESERDEQFVRDVCQKAGITLTVDSADVSGFAKDNHLSVELAARKLRYRFFESLDTDVIATAHHADDNLETVLLNLTRGTALSGLCGIPPKRERFIRPLILCTRDEIEEYCRERGIGFVTDSTNLCDDYTRNKLRHNVVPVLSAINSAVETAVLRTSCSLREDEDFINSIVSKQYDAVYNNDGIDISEMGGLHPSIAKRIILRFCESEGIEVDSLHINNIYEICLSGGRTSVSGNNFAVAKNGYLKIIPQDTEPQKASYQVDICESENDLFKNCEKVHNLLLKNAIDCDKIVGKLVFRTRQSGDTIRLKNKNCTKTLKKLFTEYSVPVEERGVWPVICDDEGVVWVYKIGVAERCAADEDSQKIYKINVKKSFTGDFINE